MSLRVFHIVFVIVTIVLSLFVALWGIRAFEAERDVAALALAILFLVTAVVLTVYGKKVARKLKELP
jgi:uncharacterized PurR-regulated membrane protein YhhQ (DUF165 family)